MDCIYIVKNKKGKKLEPWTRNRIQDRDKIRCLQSHFVDNMPSHRGRGKPRRVPMDEEAALAPHDPPPQGDPQAQPKFLIPPMP